MKLKKMFCLDENYLFDNCNICGEELKPYSVTSEELNNVLDADLIKNLILSELLRINAIDVDVHIIFICEKCSPIIRGEL